MLLCWHPCRVYLQIIGAMKFLQNGKKPDILIIGGGLAGCEAAWQLAKKGFPVTLAEMKPQRFSPAHHSECLAELVCSNSLKSELLAGASGLLKAEMRRFDSLVLSVAEACRVPAGAALAVDRDEFAKEMTLLVEKGAVILGGCCGTTPEHIAAVK